MTTPQTGSLRSGYYAVDRIVGTSASACRLRRRISQVSGYSYNVLICGPAGSGKELVARALHAQSPRFNQPLIPVGCDTLPHFACASQLFGQVAGDQVRMLGALRCAGRGTVLLRNVDQLDIQDQARLAETLALRAVTPEGSNRPVKFNARLIATSRKPLEHAVRDGQFLPDLYFRLSPINIEIVSLASRAEDLAPLAHHILCRLQLEDGRSLQQFTRQALDVLESWPWPGNVRELEAVVDEASFEATGDVWIGVRHLPAELVNHHVSQLSQGQWPTLEQVQRDHIQKTLDQVSFDLSRAAELLGMDHEMLSDRMLTLGIVQPRRRFSI